MSLVKLLVHCFLASRAFLVVLAVCALSDQVRGQGADLDALSAFAADYQHGTSVEVVHVFVVLLHESFVHSLAEFAYLVLVDLVGHFRGWLFGVFDELVSCV